MSRVGGLQIPDFCAASCSINGGKSHAETANNPIKNREELKNKRKLPFNLYLKNPMYTRLALEIKTLDDQLADSTQLLARK